jgi:hypothetical protein
VHGDEWPRLLGTGATNLIWLLRRDINRGDKRAKQTGRSSVAEYRGFVNECQSTPIEASLLTKSVRFLTLLESESRVFSTLQHSSTPIFLKRGPIPLKKEPIPLKKEPIPLKEGSIQRFLSGVDQSRPLWVSFFAVLGQLCPV